MITRRHRTPIGFDGDTPYYNFFAQLKRHECDLLLKAKERAHRKLGGTVSNPLFLIEVLQAYVADEVAA